MAGNLSDGTTVFVSNVSIGGVNSNAAGFGKLSVASVIQVVGGPTLSKGSLDLFTNSVQLSIGTGSASGMTIGNLRITLLSSGISLLYSSGKSVYDFVSLTSAVQP